MNYIIFDLEATCWENDRTKQNEIIEIGAVKLDENLAVIGEFQTFIKPKLNPILSDFCKKLTSISQEEVDQAPTRKNDWSRARCRDGEGIADVEYPTRRNTSSWNG